MSKPEIESTIELLHSYRASIRVLEREREGITLALEILRRKMLEHIREHGFVED